MIRFPSPALATVLNSSTRAWASPSKRRARGCDVDSPRTQAPRSNSPLSLPQQQISGHENKEHHRDDAVHGEERGVELGEVGGRDERVNVGKEKEDKKDNR